MKNKENFTEGFFFLHISKSFAKAKSYGKVDPEANERNWKKKKKKLTFKGYEIKRT